MEYKKLGYTDIEVSKICLGTMTFGQQNSEKEAHEQLDYAISQGVNFIDTAELYAVPATKETQGLTEEYIGSWLTKSGKRKDVVLASKVAGPAPWLDYLRGGPKFTKKQMDEALENSLKRLQTDYMDLYQLHWPERKTNFFGKLSYEFDESDEWQDNILEVRENLESYVKEGKIRAYGLSNETPWGVMKHFMASDQLGYKRPVSIQNPYSLLNRVFEVGLAEMAIREQCGLLAYSPLAFGMLTGKYRSGKQPDGARLTLFPRMARYSGEESLRATDKYCDLAEKHGLSPTTLALSFINDRPFVTSNIIGATTMEQLKENIASANVKLSDELLKEIDDIHKIIPNPAP